MSDFLSLVNQRQSTRRFLSTPIPRDQIDKCLEAARLAPSACNSQPWEFIVADKPDSVKALSKAAFSGLYSMNAFASEAPILIAVVTKFSSPTAQAGALFRRTHYNLIDIGIACEHLVLAAAELGIGSCWLGWFNEKAVKKYLGIPRFQRIDVLLSLGFPEQKEQRPKQRKPLAEIRKFRN